MRILFFLSLISILISCESNKKVVEQNGSSKILFLHHSTGLNVWLGSTDQETYNKTKKGDIQKYFDDYNEMHLKEYTIKERFFPKEIPYGWKNYPFDYYNIWVRNAGKELFMEETTLEILTEEYDVIIFKHCYPVSNIMKDTGNPDINSEEKRIENYKLQYNALKVKMREFPERKFIVWTPAVRVQVKLTEAEALRTRDFYRWMIDEWDEKGDNIYTWDYYNYATEGGLYLLDKNSAGPGNSHPSTEFSARLAPLLGQYIVDVIEGRAE